MAKADADLPLPELVKVYAERDVRLRTVATVRRDFGMVQALMNWCHHGGLIENNPAEGMKPLPQKVGAERRMPYSGDDLRLIFTSPLYTGAEDLDRRWHPGSLVQKDECWWLPLLAVFSGCRLEELGQLRVTDVRTQDGVALLDINTLDDDKRLKSGSSRRLVPLSRVLEDLGFLRYVDGQRFAGESMVFPHLKPDKFGKRTAAWSKWWGRYARKIGIVDRRKVFHSFRHSFKDACREAGIPQDIHDALTGHAPNNVGGSYGKGHSLHNLALAINRIAYADVDLRHLM